MRTKTLSRGTVKRIHVVQANIRANRKDGGQREVFTIQTSSGPIRAHDVKIRGSANLIYSPSKPLKCGARVWIETRAAVDFTPA